MDFMRTISESVLGQPGDFSGRRFSVAGGDVSVEEVKEQVGAWWTSHPLLPIPFLVFRLLRTLIASGPRWCVMALRLFIFSALLMPAWIRLASYYLLDPCIVKNIPYGDHPRNLVDVYVPSWKKTKNGTKHPVLVFFCGGAWIIGYKAWACLLAKILTRFGIIVIAPDYRNYPQGTVTDMMEDVGTAINFALTHCEEFGGDPKRVWVGGQSAGAHLSLLTMIDQAKKKRAVELNIMDPEEWRKCPDFDLSVIRGYIGVSGPYDVAKYADHFVTRGLDRSVLDKIFESSSLKYYSVTDRVSRSSFDHISTLMPPEFHLFHGTKDLCIPHSATRELANALRGKGINVATERYYPGRTHTDIILEDLMHTGLNINGDLSADIATVIDHDADNDAQTPPSRRNTMMEVIYPDDNIKETEHVALAPLTCIKWAKLVNPF